jgi:O-antigen/teichoic acid export membrane protein
MLNMGKTSATGSFQIFVGKVLSTVLLAVGAIIVGIFISETDYGLYSIALIPSTTMVLFISLGVNVALIRYCALYRAKNQKSKLRKLILSGVAFEVTIGLVLTLLSFLIANSISSSIFNQPDSTFLISLASFIILSTSLLSPAQAVFVGFERMDLHAFTLVCQGVSYFLCPLLVYMGYGALGAVVGYTLSYFIAGLIAIILLYLAIFRKLEPDYHINSTMFQTLKPMLRYGFPIAITSIFAGVLLQFYNFMMGSFCDLAMIGNYRIATNFAIILTFFTLPISTVLFPAFSKLDARRELQLLKTVFASSVKYTAFLLIPATLAVMVLSEPLINTIYSGKWSYAPFFLTLPVIINLFSIFGNISLSNLLTGLGETKIWLRLNILTLCIGIPLAFAVIPTLKIVGVIICTVVSGVPGMFIGLRWIWKHYGTKADFNSSAKIFAASALSALATYILLNIFAAVAWAKLALGLILFIAVYLVATPLIGAINQGDINNLRSMFSGLGVLSKLLNIPLSIMEKPLKIRFKHAEIENQ